MSVLQIHRVIPYNAHKAIAEERKIQAGKGVIACEDVEKAFPLVLSDFTFIVVAVIVPQMRSIASGSPAQTFANTDRGRRTLP